MLLDKPSILIFIICTCVIVVVVILCCFCIIGRGGYKKKQTSHELPTPSVSIGRSRPLWPPQTYHDVEFGQGFRTYRQDMSQRSEQSVRPDTRGSRRSERTDRQDTRESGIKDGGMAILAGAGAAIATAAAVLGLSSDQGGEDIDGGYVDTRVDGTDADGVYGGGGGGCGNRCQN